jgi:hypothetical protein
MHCPHLVSQSLRRQGGSSAEARSHRRAFSSHVASDSSKHAAKRHDYSLAWHAKTPEKQAEKWRK